MALTHQYGIAEQSTRFAAESGACTRTGISRDINEDAHYADPIGNIFIVADGVGGSAGGEMASRMAVELLGRRLGGIDRGPELSEERAIETIEDAFSSASGEISRAAVEDIRYHRMGTTAVAALIRGTIIYLANVGDSRAYLLRDGRLKQLTIDHTFAQALLDAGTISRAELPRHPWRNILSRYLGGNEGGTNPDIRIIELHDNDRLLLATDGLTDVVNEHILLRIMQQEPDSQSAATALIQAAHQKNARDDATCMVLTLREVPPEY
jgi:protein phosphatase